MSAASTDETKDGKKVVQMAVHWVDLMVVKSAVWKADCLAVEKESKKA